MNLLLGYYAGDKDALEIAEKAKKGEVSSYTAPPDQPVGMMGMVSHGIVL
jgi:hypothetical protein